MKAVVGGSGGSMIIAATTEVLINHFIRGMDPLAAVVAPRSYHQVTSTFQWKILSSPMGYYPMPMGYGGRRSLLTLWPWCIYAADP